MFSSEGTIGVPRHIITSPTTTKTSNIGCWVIEELIEALALRAGVEGSGALEA